MNYELAKRLKEAGFKCNGHAWNGTLGETLPVPSLEELIEACGENLKQMNNHGYSRWGSKRWTAKSRERELSGKLPRYVDYSGSTPLEAVANLWLALNQKKEPRRDKGSIMEYD